jgi:hypothetical protein
LKEDVAIIPYYSKSEWIRLTGTIIDPDQGKLEVIRWFRDRLLSAGIDIKIKCYGSDFICDNKHKQVFNDFTDLFQEGFIMQSIAEKLSSNGYIKEELQELPDKIPDKKKEELPISTVTLLSSENDLPFQEENTISYKDLSNKRFWTAAEILNTEFPDPVWIIPELIPEGLTYLIGRPKKGKSWLALQIAKEFSSGGNILNQDIPNSGKVLYLALEDEKPRLKTRLRKLKYPETHNVVFTHNWNSFDDRGITDLELTIQEEGYKLVIIDSIYRLSRADQSDEKVIGKIIERLQEYALSNQIGIIAIDHIKKSHHIEGDPIDDLIGTTAKARTADTFIGLYPKGNYSLLKCVSRDYEEKEIRIVKDPDTCEWLTEERQMSAPAMKAVLDYLDNKLEWVTLKEISDALDMDRSNIHKKLAILHQEEKIIKMDKDNKISYGSKLMPR